MAYLANDQKYHGPDSVAGGTYDPQSDTSKAVFQHADSPDSGTGA
jgi:hypothetical protein